MRVGVTLVVAALLAATPANAAVLYSITDLGTLGGTSSSASGINVSGWVTGFSNLVGDTISQAFLYVGSKMKDLGARGSGESAGSAINNSGQVTGRSNSGDGKTEAFLYDGTKIAGLGTLGGSY